MKKFMVFLFSAFIWVIAYSTEPDYDALIQYKYPSAKKDVNYHLVKNIDGFSRISDWKVTLSTPTMESLAALQGEYNASAAKATKDQQAIDLKLKLGITDANILTLKEILK